MIVQPYQLYVERRDATRNMARYYALSIEPDLFGEVCLRRRWGRIGSTGQAKTHSFDDEKDAVALLLEILRQKQKRGYRPRGATAERRRLAIRDAGCLVHKTPAPRIDQADADLFANNWVGATAEPGSNIRHGAKEDR